ncbi:MAG: hypothetical protein ACQEXJ_10205 [Myxococcota bacterium]
MTASHGHVTKFLRRLQKALRNEDVLVADKAFGEATHELGMGIVEIFEVFEELAPVDFDARVPSSTVLRFPATLCGSSALSSMTCSSGFDWWSAKASSS